MANPVTPVDCKYTETHEWIKVVKEAELQARMAKAKETKTEKGKAKAAKVTPSKDKEKDKDKAAKKKIGKLTLIGVTDFATSKLSDLVHIELPKVGDEVKQGEVFGEIESVKTVAELYSPVTGKIAALNEDAITGIEIISKDPYDEGWLIAVELSDPSELDSLMSAEEYDSFIKTSEASEEGGEEIDEDYFV